MTPPRSARHPSPAKVAQSFRAEWQGPVVHHDLAVSPVPHLSAAVISARITDPAQHTPEQAEAAKLQKEFKVRLTVTASGKFQPVAYDTLVTIGRIVRESGLKWTIVRFPLLPNGPETASINVRKVGDKGGLRLSRANAAAYYLQQLTDVSFLGYRRHGKSSPG
ncbi:NAD(P)H-binding protein [Streptomyces sp. NPDC049687]|uniref:NAD(P)H-binding protein n=1 Tax=Streptomyces sp. NPDC049687 TaxID=3365596 RepID=UPI0037A3048F